DDHYLIEPYAHAQRPGKNAEKKNGCQKCRHVDAVYRQRVYDDEHDADESRENQIDRQRDELLDIGPHLLELAECLAAALVLEDGVGQLEGVSDPIRVHLGSYPLDDDVDVVILEVLCNS